MQPVGFAKAVGDERETEVAEVAVAEDPEEAEEAEGAEGAGAEELAPAGAFSPHGPTGAVAAEFTMATSFPGVGNSRSLFGTVSHPLPKLAWNISGRSESPLLPPPEIVTAAQFMYISLLPRLLNQVLHHPN